MLLTNGIENPELGVDVMVLLTETTGVPEIDVLETDVPVIADIEVEIVVLIEGNGGA